MEPGIFLRIIMVGTGLWILLLTVLSLARRRLTEAFCLAWGIIAICFIIAGIVLNPNWWNLYISFEGLLLACLIGFCLIYGVYFVSSNLADVIRKNTELAMQVTLLNTENTELRQELMKIKEAIKDREEEE
ncbi:MAG: hypothetical protein IJ608_04215 [Lachnospiraceae bacterium]|nr:hypothetical protein [Lachnospiraceae bacterium]